MTLILLTVLTNPEATMNEALILTAEHCPDAKQVERIDGVVVLKDPGAAGPQME